MFYNALSKYRSTHSGVTLVELMVTIAVASILLTVAVPSFQDAIQRNRLTSATNNFVVSIHYARTEAIKRGQNVTLCKSSSGTSCVTGTGTFWENGWIVFVDTDKDGTLDTGETLLRAWPRLPTGYSLRTNTSNFVNKFSYNPRGELHNNEVGGTFAICYNNQLVGAKAVVITKLRPWLGMDQDGDRIPENKDREINSCTNP